MRYRIEADVEGAPGDSVVDTLDADDLLEAIETFCDGQSIDPSEVRHLRTRRIDEDGAGDDDSDDD